MTEFSAAVWVSGYWCRALFSHGPYHSTLQIINPSQYKCFTLLPQSEEPGVIWIDFSYMSTCGSTSRKMVKNQPPKYTLKYTQRYSTLVQIRMTLTQVAEFNGDCRSLIRSQSPHLHTGDLNPLQSVQRDDETQSDKVTARTTQWTAHC